MSSREQILARIKENRPAQTSALGEWPFAAPPLAERLGLFMKSIQAAGGVVVQVTDLAFIGAYLKEHYDSPDRVLNTVAGIGFGLEANETIAEGRTLAQVEIAVVEGQLGVAENGSVWVTENQLPARALPFICEHLALIVRQADIVGTMHEAYETIDVAATGYGTFIAGPSRTADIEQSLVIGAHGPKRTHVFILQKN